MELFPNFRGASWIDNLVGISAGLLIGLFFINFLDYVVEWAEAKLESALNAPKAISGSENHGSPGTATDEALHNLDDVTLHGLEEHVAETDVRPILALANQSMKSEAHRERLRQKITDLLDSIDIIQNKSELLLSHKTIDPENPIMRRPSWELNNSKEEKHADEIDEQIHRLQYNLDHCRRLVCVYSMFLVLHFVLQTGSRLRV